MNQEAPLKLLPVEYKSVSIETQAVLDQVQEAWGTIPNLIRIFAHSSSTLRGAWDLAGAFWQSSFTPSERQALLLTASVENSCGYCTAAHTAMGAADGMTSKQLAALSGGCPTGDRKLDALAEFTRVLMAKRGFASEDDVSTFLSAGYAPEQALEVVLGVALKTLTNYTNHLTHTPIDEAFAQSVQKVAVDVA